jgi:hypothetical protein
MVLLRANGAAFKASLGQRPKIHSCAYLLALKARFIPMS